MGGTSLPDVHTLPNLMAVTHQIHNLANPSIHMRPSWAKDNGWLVPAWDDPALIPIMLLGRRRVWLTSDGQYASGPPAG